MVSRRLVVTLLNGRQSVASGSTGDAASSGYLAPDDCVSVSAIIARSCCFGHANRGNQVVRNRGYSGAGRDVVDKSAFGKGRSSQNAVNQAGAGSCNIGRDSAVNAVRSQGSQIGSVAKRSISC